MYKFNQAGKPILELKFKGTINNQRYHPVDFRGRNLLALKMRFNSFGKQDLRYLFHAGFAIIVKKGLKKVSVDIVTEIKQLSEKNHNIPFSTSSQETDDFIKVVCFYRKSELEEIIVEEWYFSLDHEKKAENLVATMQKNFIILEFNIVKITQPAA